MILFQEDWGKHPTAIMDTSTTNESWIRIAAILKSMGVTNHAFPLALHNPNLVGVDPHSPNLTQEQIYAVVVEAKENPWYALREVIRIPAIAGSSSIPLRANRANISTWWLLLNHVTAMLIQPRQTGKSVSIDCLMTWLFGIALMNSEIFLLTKDDSLRTKNVARIKGILEELPPYLRLRSRKDTYNTEMISLTHLNNQYVTAVAQASEKAAANIGRGRSIPIFHVDEIAFITNIKTTLESMLPAGGAARDQAKAAGAPYFNVFTTTPGFLTSASGRYAYSIYNDCFRWTEKFFDAQNEADLHDKIRKNSPSGKLQVLCEYNHRQLGFTDAWLKEKIEAAMSEGENTNADFLNIWGEGNESSPISKENMAKIVASRVLDPIVDVQSNGYVIKWYVTQQEVDDYMSNRKLVLGLDTSNAYGGKNDNIALCIRDVSTGEVVGAGLYNETNLVHFAEWLANLLIDYENMTAVIENKSSGTMIIDYLINILRSKGQDPFARLFNWVVNDYKGVPQYEDEVINVEYWRRDERIYTKYRKEFGYATSGSGRSSRDNLYGPVFTSYINICASTVRDNDLIKQLQGLTYRNGRIDHAVDGHDDLVIGSLLSHFFIIQGKNLDFYGINPRSVLRAVKFSSTNSDDHEKKAYEEAKQASQTRLLERIDDLMDELKKTTDPVRFQVLTAQIKHLNKDVLSDTDSYNIDGHIQKIKAEKYKLNKAIWQI